jgi:hypothetical protein
MMLRISLCLVVAGTVVAPIGAQPRQFSDDFTAVATYDSASLWAPCTGGPSTRYTMMELVNGETYTQRGLSGAGRFIFTNRSLAGLVGRVDIAAIGVLDVGQECPDNPNPSPGASLITSEPFTSNNVCVYGGMQFNHWQLRFPYPTSGFSTLGPDGQPGIAGVDDDIDGTTDETNEILAARPTTVQGGYGNRNGTGFQAGRDAAPGVAGVDDDGSGIVDDIGETGWPGSDDGDDLARHLWWILLDCNLGASKTMYLNMDVGGTNDVFALREVLGISYPALQNSDSIGAGFYQLNVHYNWVFCTSGSCYGAELWTASDMANPAEVLGPLSNSRHTGPNDNLVAMGFVHNKDSIMYLRQMRFLGNSNFNDTFWVVSGNPTLYYPSPSADLDKDKDVDGFDFLTFSNCYNGSNRAPLAACTNGNADLDKDGDVDGFDFLTFSNCYNGSNRRPLTACFPPNLTTLASCSPPSNDTCATAQAVTEGSTLSELPLDANDDIACPADEGGRDVWFVYTPTATGTITISTCDRTGLTGYVDDAELTVRSGTCGGATLVGPCRDTDACGTGGSNKMETISGVPVSAGVPIYIAVQGEDMTDSGPFILTITVE